MPQFFREPEKLQTMARDVNHVNAYLFIFAFSEFELSKKPEVLKCRKNVGVRKCRPKVIGN